MVLRMKGGGGEEHCPQIPMCVNFVETVALEVRR